MINVGDCFTLHSHGKPHLHIVIQEQKPGDDNCQVICVYLSSIGQKSIIDDRTILEKGQHRFITERSFVKYNNVSLDSKRDLENKIIKFYEPISREILKEIQAQFFNRYKNIQGTYLNLFHEWHRDHIFDNPDF